MSVENGETGEVIPLYPDRTTARKETAKDPAVGDKVVVKHDEHSKHAVTLAASQTKGGGNLLGSLFRPHRVLRSHIAPAT